MAYFTVFTALAGAFLTAQKTNRMRRHGFIVWIYTNGFWIWYNWGDWAMVAQFSLFFFLCFLGIWNNQDVIGGLIKNVKHGAPYPTRPYSKEELDENLRINKP